MEQKKGLVGQMYKTSENARCLKLVVIHFIVDLAGTLWNILKSIMLLLFNHELLLLSQIFHLCEFYKKQMLCILTVLPLMGAVQFYYNF